MKLTDFHVSGRETVEPARHSHSQAIVDGIAASALFAGVDPAEVGRILDEFDEQSFNRGHRITLEGLRGSDFYIIADGKARVTVDGWKVATLTVGDFFGEIAVLSNGPRFATVAAETPLRCLVLPNGGLERLLIAHPRVGVNLLRVVVGRFQELTGPSDPPHLRLATS
jgi:CRP/FNR family transcriptional regulator, cyclic AMP receptor protein